MVFYFTGTGNSLYVAKQLEKFPVSIPQAIHDADLYYNEEQVGSAIKKSGIVREELFLTTKVWVDIASFTKIPPMVNQVETHIFNQQKTAKEYMDKYKVQMEAWAPFGEGRGGTFDNPVIAEIAAKYGKSTAQVMLRWHIQRGVVVIPKSTHKERMAENFNVFDFALSDEDMAKIAALDAEKSSFFSHYDPAMVEWFVQMVEERKKQHDSSKGA
jgi:diketogulonate reductase-like aldo/keto reductase